MDLQQYERAKFDLASILRAGTRTRAAEEIDARIAIRDLFARLAEDRFNLAVVGRFNRGKTSLMNAVIGFDRLPTGIVPLTSVITTVSYGSEPRAVLHFQDSSLIEDVPLDQLAANITERGNPGNRRRIRVAEVQVPAEILRRGFFLIDTPGLGSAIAENTRTTEAFLPEADALVLVTSYDSPLTEEERRLLDLAQTTRRRVFVVLNKLDAATPDERGQVEAHLRAQLAQAFGAAVPGLYPVSARQALAARLAGDEAALDGSGLPALERDLIAFLVEERRGEFLRLTCDRVAAVMARCGAGPEPYARLERLRAARGDATGDATGEAAGSRGAELAATIPECGICRAAADAAFDFLARLQAQLGRDPDVEAEFARRGGLCLLHAGQFERLAAPRETCTGFAAVLDAQAARLDALAAGLPRPATRLCEAVDGLLPDAGRCQACAAVLARVGDATAAMAAELDADPSRLERLSAICLPHLGGLAARLPADGAGRLLRRQSALLRRLADDMRRFALQQDAARRALASREDLAAAQRGLRALTGRPEAGTAPGPPG